MACGACFRARARSRAVHHRCVRAVPDTASPPTKGTPLPATSVPVAPKETPISDSQAVVCSPAPVKPIENMIPRFSPPSQAHIFAAAAAAVIASGAYVLSTFRSSPHRKSSDSEQLPHDAPESISQSSETSREPERAIGPWPPTRPASREESPLQTTSHSNIRENGSRSMSSNTGASEPVTPCWWQMEEVYLLNRRNLEELGPGAGPVGLVVGGEIMICGFESKGGAGKLRDALQRWASSSAELDSLLGQPYDASQSLQVDVINPPRMDLSAVPMVVLVRDELLEPEQLVSPAAWRSLVLEDVQGQRQAWAERSRRSHPATHKSDGSSSDSDSPPRSDTAAAACGYDTDDEESPSTIYDDSADVPVDDSLPGEDGPAPLTSQQTDASLVLRDPSLLPCVFVPLIMKPGEGQDPQMLTLDVSLSPDVRDVVALVFEDPVDARALLAVLGYVTGFTAEEKVERKVLPMAADSAAVKAGRDDSSLLCLKAGFAQKAGVRVGVQLDIILSTLAGARWAAQVEEQLEVAKSEAQSDGD